MGQPGKKSKKALTSDVSALLNEWYGPELAAKVDSAPPDVGTLVWTQENRFEWTGGQHRPDLFEYYRCGAAISAASQKRAIAAAESKGYTALPVDADVYQRGVRADGDVIMIRTIESGDNYREADRIRLESEKNGVFTGSKSLAADAHLKWTDQRSRVEIRRPQPEK